jgi:hypothetical protein
MHPLRCLLALSSTVLACGSADDGCRCLVEIGVERRALACGEAACVGERNLSCADRDQIVERGQCLTSPTAPSETEAPPAGGAQPGSRGEPSCEQLLAYCTSSCTAPAATAADCQAAASAGDLEACRGWPLANGVLCRP